MTVSNDTSKSDGTDAESSGTETSEPGDDDRIGYLPIRYRWLSIAFYVGIMLWVSYLFIELRKWGNFEDWLVPSIAGVLLLLLIAAQIGKTILSSPVRDGDDESDLESKMGVNDSSKEEYDNANRDKRMLILAGWIIALPISIYLFGFLLAMPLYIFLFEWYLIRNLKTALVMTAFALALLYVLFVVILGVGLWEGLIDIPILHRYI